ncbi:MAG: 2-hydroxyacyl-CoA dehydratase [Candidatus Firestonebacteria bacterium]|nr:2-hydroxyacyl-CoA dehydratase [Candidatus Firestonebacteria bacterium]
MEKIGITTTIPIEILIAGKVKPLDLNNIFITSGKCSKYIEDAESLGFPRTTCSWIKGIYSACLKLKLNRIIAVTQGDCSNTHALMETLQMADVNVIPFAYPYAKDKQFLQHEIQKLLDLFNVKIDYVNDVKYFIDNNIREKLRLIDMATWQNNLVRGEENHYFLVNSSDFKGNIYKFRTEINKFLNNLSKRKPIKNKIRIGYIGVPSVFSDLYEYIENLGGHTVFNEIQRQFSMPYSTSDIIEQYLAYTYPYSIFERIEDINNAVAERKIHGIINYVQTFCFRHIEDIVLRQKINIPMLTIEGDKPGKLDARTKIRIETFMQMLKQNI